MKGVTKYLFFIESDFIGSAQESPERILKDIIPPGFRVEPRRTRTLEERRISNRSPSAANETDNDGVIIAAARLFDTIISRCYYGT